MNREIIVTYISLLKMTEIVNNKSWIPIRIKPMIKTKLSLNGNSKNNDKIKVANPIIK